MKIKLNPDTEIVNTIKEGLKKTGGYCPCRREKTDDTKCMCKEFKDQIADPNFEGFCHCMLYYNTVIKYNKLILIGGISIFPDWVAQFSFGFYSLMLTSLLIGLIVMIFFKPRTWCAFCPMGTMTQAICKLRNRKRGK